MNLRFNFPFPCAPHLNTHLLCGWGQLREYRALYPQARVLVADKEEVTKAHRKAFVARCATGDWDAVVMAHSSFERIPVSAHAQARFLDAEMAEFRAAIAASEQRGGLTVKRLQTALVKLEERHKKLVNNERRDDGVCWEAMGVDYVFYDEAHAVKNLAFPSHVQGVGGKGSMRAEDVSLKLHSLRERHGARVATFATATPISNTVAEMYVMQRYLQPEVLEAAGIASFDAWAATFGRPVTTLELTPDGGNYRMKTRFARFANVPELAAMFRAVADLRTAEQLGLPTPKVAGGRAETVVVAPSEGLQDYVATLVERADRVRLRAVKPAEDNMLWVSNDGRNAALDLRLVGLVADPDGGKITAAAERIATIWRANAERVYLGERGQADPRRGALQLVFCELGTPRPGWNVYDELRDQLLARGLPGGQVRFIHEAASDRAKAELFEACRTGRVAVLIGSTQKMGVGTNVQRRAIALHHLDAPWKPADIEQREGRILRQGNQNDVVEILRYVTERSFDVFMWQTLERKAGFIHQVSRNEELLREVDDVGETELSFAEVKALATGNPLIMERAGLENEIAKLQRLAHAHRGEQRALTVRQRDAQARSERMLRLAETCEAAASRRCDTRGDRFAMTVGGTRHRSRVDAGVDLRLALLALLDAPRPKGSVGRIDGTVTAGELGGFDLVVDVTRWANETTDAVIRVEDLPVAPLKLKRSDLAHADPVGLIARLENRVLKLEETAASCRAQSIASHNEAEEVAVRIGRPFDHQMRLEGLSGRLSEIDALLAEASDDRTVDATGDTPGPTGRAAAVGGDTSRNGRR